MSFKKKFKQWMSSVLGEETATWLHALRFIGLIYSGRNQEIEIALLKHFPLNGCVAVDIGANSANWTVPLSRWVGNSGLVFAFEADPYYAVVTKKTLQLLGLKNTRFFPFGLSDRDETLPLKIFDGAGQRFSGESRLVKDAEKQEAGTVLVPLHPLDGLLATNPRLRQTALIKCDVEGFEFKVYQGAQEILHEARPVVVSEMSRDTDLEAVFGLFLEMNYKCYVAVTPNKVRLSEKAGKIPEGERPNRIFIPAEFPMPATISILE